MMDDDKKIQELLKAVAPRGEFDADVTRDRIVETIRLKQSPRRWFWPWSLFATTRAFRLVVVLAVFGAGIVAGRVTVGTPIGNAVLQLPVWLPADNPPPRSDLGPDVIDLRNPVRLSPTAVDMSLGMAIRCTGCRIPALGDDSLRIVPQYPTVEVVEPEGVAEEAGLQVGDSIVWIDGVDVMTARGAELLGSMQQGRDFDIRYARNAARGTAHINRRIVDVRIITRTNPEPTIRIQRRGNNWGSRLLEAISRWIGEIGSGIARSILARGTGGQEQAEWIAEGDNWGPSGLGLLFRVPDSTLFHVGSDGSLRLAERPVVGRVPDGGPGFRAGLRSGDLITHVNGNDILSPRALGLFLVRKDSLPPLVIDFLRDSEEHRATLAREQAR